MVSPDGMPSRMVISARPWDSPAVRNRSICASFYPKNLRGLDARPRRIPSKTDGPSSCTDGVARRRSRGAHCRSIRRRRSRSRDRSRHATSVCWSLSSTAGGPTEQAQWAERCAWFCAFTQPVDRAARSTTAASARRSASRPGRCSPGGADAALARRSRRCRVRARFLVGERARADCTARRMSRVPRRAVRLSCPMPQAGMPSTNSPIPARRNAVQRRQSEQLG